MQSFLFLCTALFSTIVFASGLSASRGAHESAAQAQARSFLNFHLSQNPTSWDTQAVGPFVQVHRAKVPLRNLDLTTIPELPSKATLDAEFTYIRDLRFLKSYNDLNFLRRLTWLFPDDGCYARAEMAKRKLVEHQQIAPKKIFVFGDLEAVTPNTASGRITWWYHVAAIYRVGNEPYVFDPSIEPRRALTLDEWNAAVGGNQTDVQYSLCAPDAFDPNSDCNNPKETNIATVLSEQNSFLRPEWHRIESLQRDPTQELGDFPPWLN